MTKELRDAFVLGARWAAYPVTLDRAEAAAKVVYPTPRRPREIKVAGVGFRIRNGVLEFRPPHLTSWWLAIPINDIDVLFDLIDNPTEEVPE